MMMCEVGQEMLMITLAAAEYAYACNAVTDTFANVQQTAAVDGSPRAVAGIEDLEAAAAEKSTQLYRCLSRQR
jgi:hypothetical protein